MKITDSMRWIVLVIALSCTAGVSAQTLKEKLNTLVEGLNDADPIIRLVTYEEAINSGDATLQRVAMRTALQGSDTDLRAMALRGAFVDRGVVTFKIGLRAEVAKALEAAGEDPDAIAIVKKRYGYSMPAAYANVLSIKIDNYDFKTGNLSGHCLNNVTAPTKKYVVSGTIAGDEISLQTACYISGYINCTLQAELDQAGVLQGTFGCTGYPGATATATMDLL